MSSAFTTFELSSGALISYCFSYSAPSAIHFSFFTFLIVSNNERYWHVLVRHLKYTYEMYAK